MPEFELPNASIHRQVNAPDDAPKMGEPKDDSPKGLNVLGMDPPSRTEVTKVPETLASQIALLDKLEGRTNKLLSLKARSPDEAGLTFQIDKHAQNLEAAHAAIQKQYGEQIPEALNARYLKSKESMQALTGKESMAEVKEESLGALIMKPNEKDLAELTKGLSDSDKALLEVLYQKNNAARQISDAAQHQGDPEWEQVAQNAEQRVKKAETTLQEAKTADSIRRMLPVITQNAQAILSAIQNSPPAPIAVRLDRLTNILDRLEAMASTPQGQNDPNLQKQIANCKQQIAALKAEERRNRTVVGQSGSQGAGTNSGRR
ncbi:MAG: hypothetical protein V4534_02060 [Myxococcota bacterium]